MLVFGVSFEREKHPWLSDVEGRRENEWKESVLEFLVGGACMKGEKKSQMSPVIPSSTLHTPLSKLLRSLCIETGTQRGKKMWQIYFGSKDNLPLQNQTFHRSVKLKPLWHTCKPTTIISFKGSNTFIIMQSLMLTVSSKLFWGN